MNLSFDTESDDDKAKGEPRSTDWHWRAKSTLGRLLNQRVNALMGEQDRPPRSAKIDQLVQPFKEMALWAATPIPTTRSINMG
jgi:hypothetical protein